MTLDRRQFLLSSSAIAFSASQGALVSSRVDLVRDFGGSLEAWNTFYSTQTEFTTLTIPPGSYGNYSTSSLVTGPGPGCLIVGTGLPEITVSIVMIGKTDSPPFTNHQPRFHAASAGAGSITLINPSDSPNFLVGKWVILMCLDLQGSGFPQNNHFFEYKKIAAIEAVSGVITFDSPLMYDYVETYPTSANSGTPSYPDQAGSPTIMSMGPTWDQEVIIRGIKIMNAVGQPFFGNARKVVWEDCVFESVNPIPSACQSWVARRCTMRGTEIEIDKLVEYLEFDTCDIRLVSNQSTSIRESVFRNCTVTQAMNGTARKTTITGCTIASMIAGPIGYGSAADSLIILNSDVADFGRQFGPVMSGNMNLADFKRVGNLLRLPRSDYNFHYQAFLVPGHWYNFNQGSNGTGFGNGVGPSFQITDLYEDGTDIVIVTTLPTGTIPQLTANPPPDGIASFSCPFTTVINSTGCSKIRILGRAPANTPLWTYYNPGTLTGTYDANESAFILGNIVSLTVNVIAPYTGVLSTLSLQPLGQYEARLYKEDYSVVTWAPTVNLKSAGERVITPSAVTGAQTGDSDLSLPGATTYNYLLGSTIAAFLSGGADISGEAPSTWPSVTIEFVTDLGISWR